MGRKGAKKSVRRVCHCSIINTQRCLRKGGRADGASKHKERNCKPKVPDTTCYYFWHKPFTIAMKVAMENIILIVCPEGFAPLTSKRHTSHICWEWWYASLFIFFILLCPSCFHKSYFRTPLPFFFNFFMWWSNYRLRGHSDVLKSRK